MLWFSFMSLNNWKWQNWKHFCI